MEYVGRSPAQIRDDSLIDIHTSLTEELNSVHLRYIGKRRQALKDLLAEVESIILGESTSNVAMLHRRHLWVLNSQNWDRFGDPRF